MKKIIIVFFTLFIGLSVQAQDYSVHKLENGQTVIIKEVHDNPIVIIDTWINTGSINENDKNNGVAHFLEHLFFKGTQKYGPNEFDKILESKGAVTNAATSKDFTHYYVLIPSKDFNLALNMHADMLMNPLIPRKELEKERSVVLEEISKNNDSPTVVLYRNLNNLLYKDHPYKREVIGKKEIIETITREEIWDFYQKWYNPSNMTTVIVGDITEAQALEQVKRNFGTAKIAETAKPVANSYKMDKKPLKQTTAETTFEVDSGYIMIGFRGPQDATLKDSYALDLLGTILGDGKSSRLYKNIKEQKQLAFSIGAGNSSFKQDSIFTISANYSPENLEKLKAAIFYEIDKLRTTDIGADELQKAKNIIERDTYYSRESVSNIANEIGYTNILTQNPHYYANYIENIKKITASDLKEAAKKYLDTNTSAISILLPKNYVKADTVKPAASKKHEAQLISQKGNISKYKLDNKAILVIDKNEANDIVAVDISVKGGNYTEKIAGIGEVTADVMLKGTKKYPGQELPLILEENGIRIVPKAKSEIFSVEMKYTKNEAKLAQDILFEVVNNAKLNPSDIEQVKNDKIYLIKKNRDNPSGVAFEEFKTIMWENTAYGNSGKVLEKTIPTIQKKDVDEFYNSVFNPENIVISVNGNVDNQEIINYFSSIFETKNQEKPVVITDYAKQFTPVSANKIKNVKKDSKTSWVVIGWQADGVINQKDWATLQVINSLLGNGMSSRLFVELRDQQGLAYQIGSTYGDNINKGAFAVYIGTNPQKTEIAKKGMLNEIDRLKKEFVSDKELTQAKDKLLGNYILALETNMEKASTVGWMEVSGRGYDFTDKLPQLIESVTVNDIITTANKYFSKPYVMVVVGP